VGTVAATIWIYGLNTPWGLNAMVPGGLIAFIAIFVVSIIDKSAGVAPAPEIEFSKK
jgi:SSS family solute:Na+ symporter